MGLQSAAVLGCVRMCGLTGGAFRKTMAPALSRPIRSASLLRNPLVLRSIQVDTDRAHPAIAHAILRPPEVLREISCGEPQ